MALTYDGSSWRIQDSNLMERVHTAETGIEQNSKDIKLKANTNDVYNKENVNGLISKEVTDRDAAIELSAAGIRQTVSETYATKTALNNKADSSTVTALTERVTTAESTITQHSADITARVTKTEFEALEIGGRNLFKGSATLSGGEWTKDQASAVVVSDGIAAITKATNGNSRIYQMPANGYWSWITGENYVVSIDARSDTDSCQLFMNAVGAGSNLSKGFNVTTDWKRYSFAFTSTNGGTGSMSFYNYGATGDVLQVRRPKLEKGNKATAWTPAPEDLEAYADKVVSDAKLEIDADGIRSEVSKISSAKYVNSSTAS